MKSPFYYFDMLSAVARKPYVDMMMSELYHYHKNVYFHSIRVAMLSIQIAELLGATEPQLYVLAEGAMLYDIGKTKVPVRILDKAEMLTSEERERICTHPLYSYDRIIRVKEEHSPVIEKIALLHHVYTDGSGYPSAGALPAGTDLFAIPKEVRVVTVADIFDAMVSARNYRESYSGKVAVQNLYQMVEREKVELDIVQCLEKLLLNDDLLFDVVKRVEPNVPFDFESGSLTTNPMSDEDDA